MSHLLQEHAPDGPLALARQLLDFTPDQTPSELLSTTARYVLLNCHRQWGKKLVP